MSDQPIHVLVIDDDRDLLRGLERNLTKMGFKVSTAASGAEAVQACSERKPDAAIVDYNLPDVMGDELILQLRTVQPTLICVGFTGQGDAKIALQMLSNGAVDYVDKGQAALEKVGRVLHREVQRLRHDAKWADYLRKLILNTRPRGEIVGASPPMVHLREQIQRAGQFKEHNVVIYGPSGTGKERVATAIHDAAVSVHGLKGQLIALNMATLPENLAESVIFGYEKGAFTGADRMQPSIFEQAEHGTLFFDEIGEMPLLQQAKLLRALSTKTFRRVGGLKDIPFSCRIISATNRDLPAEVVKKTFREDLLYRLASIEITVPSLAERQEDIKQLTWHFIARENERNSLKVRAIDDDVWALLERYDWHKNNVRELERVIERIMVWVDDSDRITMDIVNRSRALPEEVLRSVGAQPDAEANVRQVITGGVSLDELFAMHWVDAREHVLEHFGKAYAMHHLLKASYNLTVAAEAAGMQRPNFSRFVKERGIDVEKLKEQKLRG